MEYSSRFRNGVGYWFLKKYARDAGIPSSVRPLVHSLLSYFRVSNYTDVVFPGMTIVPHFINQL